MKEALRITCGTGNVFRDKGKITLFCLDALVNIATRAGLSVRLLVKKAA